MCIVAVFAKVELDTRDFIFAQGFFQSHRIAKALNFRKFVRLFRAAMQVGKIDRRWHVYPPFLLYCGYCFRLQNAYSKTINL